MEIHKNLSLVILIHLLFSASRKKKILVNPLSNVRILITNCEKKKGDLQDLT